MGRAVFPLCCLTCNEDNGELLKKVCAPIVALSAPDPAAGHCRPAALLETSTHRQVWLSLLWGHSPFLLGPGVHKVLLCPPRVCFPGGSQSFCQIPRLGSLLWALELSQQREDFFGVIVLQSVGPLLSCSTVELMATSSENT